MTNRRLAKTPHTEWSMRDKNTTEECLGTLSSREGMCPGLRVWTKVYPYKNKENLGQKKADTLEYRCYVVYRTLCSNHCPLVFLTYKVLVNSMPYGCATIFALCFIQSS